MHERLPDVVQRDAARTAELAELGWTVLRLRNDQVIADLSGALEAISAAL